MNLLLAHPAIDAIAAFWAFSAFVGGMPAPTDKSGSGYVWFYNSMHILAGNLTSAMQSKFPNLPSGSTVTQTSASQTTDETK